ncbi:MAG: hypothetical protein ACP5U1_05030 [Desulfomonilaceae bacterium]
MFGSSVLIIIIMASICFLIGAAVIRRSFKNVESDFRIYLAPVVGLAILVCIATFHGWLYPYSWRVSITEIVILVAFALWLERKRLREYPRDLITVLILSLGISSPILIPILKFDSYNPFTDSFTYLVHGQWLQTHSFSENLSTSGYHPALTQVYLYQQGKLRMGASFLLGLVQSLFRLEWSYLAYPAVTALGLISGTFAVGAAVAKVFPKQKLTHIFIILSAGIFFNGFSYGALWGFFPQTFGLALATGFVVILGYLFDEFSRSFRWIDLVRACIPGAFVGAALIYSYNEIVPFVALSALIYFFGAIIFCRDRLLRQLLIAGAMGLVIVGLVNIELLRQIHNQNISAMASSASTTHLGWPVPWNVGEFLAHAMGIRPAYFGHHFEIIASLIAIVAFIGLFIIILSLARNRAIWEHSVVSLSLCAILSFLVGFIYFRYCVPNLSPEEIGHSFFQFKLAKWSSTFFAIFIGLALASIIGKAGSVAKPLYIVWAISIVAALGIHWFVITDGMTHNFTESVGSRRSAFSCLTRLRDLTTKVSGKDVIYLNFGPTPQHQKLREMVAYVLFDRRLAGDYRDDGYIAGSLPVNEKCIPYKEASWVIDHVDNNCLSVSAAGGTCGYLSLRKAPKRLFQLASIDGSFDSKIGKESLWRCSNGKLVFNYKVIGDNSNSKPRVSFSYRSDLNTKLNITISGENNPSFAVNSGPGWTNFVSPPISIEGDQLGISLENSGEGISGTNDHPGFCIKHIGFSDDNAFAPAD